MSEVNETMNDNKQYVVTPLKPGIVRISRYAEMPQSLLEKYGIVTIPEPDRTFTVTETADGVVLPNGKMLRFTVRPDEDNDFWMREAAYLNNKFAEKLPTKLFIEGRPEEEPIELGEYADGKDSDVRFGISFLLEEKECFYGFGEAGRDRIDLRGVSVQNWAIYQFDEIPIPFVMSNHNWGMLILACDRHFADIDDHAKGRLTVLGNRDALDVLLFYGDSMKEMLGLYTDVTGKSMLFPKWGYGLTYVAPIYQNQFEILNDLMKFREKHIPCDNVSLEPGWMTKFYDYSFEKKWDLTKFHMESWMRKRSCPRTFPSTLRRFGFHTALWLCMNYDLCDREEGLSGGKSTLVPWYEHIKPFVADGADGFKIDPADMLMRLNPEKTYTNGKSEMEMHNLSQTLVMKQMFEGFTEQMHTRPFLHYSGGYTGQQKWGGATTGDNGGLEGSMLWILNLAMSGFMNVSVDMNIFNPEAVHFAMLAPWAQHNAWSGCEQPWFAGEDNERIYAEYARLRYRLLPYIYAAAIECHETGIPMIRPMPLAFEDDENCRRLSHQYMLGESILLSAFTDMVYLPAGEWIDFWTKKTYTGPVTITHYERPKDKGGGFFIRGGAIIPVWCERDHVSQYNDESMELHVYPCGESAFVFREDDGMSLDYQTKPSCKTTITCAQHGGSVQIRIGNREGDYAGKPEKRIWDVFVHGVYDNVRAICNESPETAVVRVRKVPV